MVPSLFADTRRIYPSTKGRNRSQAQEPEHVPHSTALASHSTPFPSLIDLSRQPPGITRAVRLYSDIYTGDSPGQAVHG